MGKQKTRATLMLCPSDIYRPLEPPARFLLKVIAASFPQPATSSSIVTVKMTDPTLLIHWLFSGLAFAVMLARLVWRKVAKQPFNMGDYLTMAACICLVARVGLIHVVLTWKTNNMSAALRKTYVFTEDDIYRRTVGSKLSLVNRVFYNS